MHIPDGYLSPQTCAAAYAVAIPTLAVASRRVERVVKTRQVPMLAMFAALSFLIMMFNIPIPDGTTAHAVGAVIIAIVLGPWAAMLAVSVALLFQALLFGDGGVLAYGANVLNMAILMPVTGLATYRLIAGRSTLGSTRRLVAAAAAGWVGINVSALATAIELGIQPLLFHTADGVPLYAPYSLSQTIPAMALAHVFVAGPVEAALTVAVFRYLVRTNPVVLSGPLGQGVGPDPRRSSSAPGSNRPGSRWSPPAKVAVGVVGALVVLTPLGLLAPGGAFGESAPEELDLAALGLQAIPEGMQRYTGFWSHTLLADYGFGSGDNATLAYWLSALVGIAVVGATSYLLARASGAFRARPRSAPVELDSPEPRPTRQ